MAPSRRRALGEGKTAADAHPPAIEEMSLEHGFAHGRATEHDGFGENETGVASEVNLDGAAQPHLIKDNSLLRQPGERATGAEVELHGDLGIRSERAIHLFRGGSRYGQPRAGAEFDIDVKAVAARHAAGGVDDDGIKRAGVGAIRKTDPQRAGFMYPLAACPVGNRPLPSARHCRLRDCRRILHHLPALSQTSFLPRATKTLCQIAIARLSAPSSRPARSQA